MTRYAPLFIYLFVLFFVQIDGHNIGKRYRENIIKFYFKNRIEASLGQNLLSDHLRSQ